jgi:tetratricopeptide (TPR) repeat protein
LANTFRAVLLGEESGVFNVLKDFLFRMGLRNTVCLQNVAGIRDILATGQMPIVFIDDSPGLNEGFLLYESLRRASGMELVPFFFFVNEPESVLKKYGQAFGAKGSLTKPFNPTDLTSMIAPLSSNNLLPTHQRAITTSKALFAQDYETALKGLVALESSPIYGAGAGIALARCFLALSRYPMTEKKLTEMIRKVPNDLRVLCEIADLFMLSNKYPEAMRIFKKLEQLDPRLTVKVWDHLHLLISLDDINGASRILEKLVKQTGQRQDAVAALLRIMEFMGLQSLAPLIARHFPQLAKKYPLLDNKEAS